MIDAQMIAKTRKYDNNFVERHNHVLAAINGTIAEERMSSPWLVDSDVTEVYKALSATMKTLSSGIYYESLPDGSARVSLYRRLKAALDALMTETAKEHPVLKASDALDVLEFVTLVAQVNSSDRPRSRRYLDWISETFGYPQPQQSSGLIIP